MKAAIVGHILDGNLFSGQSADGMDVRASALAYADQIETVMQERHPEIEVSHRVDFDTEGVPSALQISGCESAEEEDRVRDWYEDAAQFVWELAGFYMLTEDNN